ncbi:hypothetical protein YASMINEVIRUS_1076 [Yasminevirus sp. GU-2018]|uniref:Uncharacterized protein n=1 Tax=Yasminevirus sp. GU-2018 TaxID=2420051 RepID=A0A5K0UAV3_9VIRU|nr:hypothetical protein YASMINEVIRUS_1076 [Yasminevirus sp. GU-2018]
MSLAGQKNVIKKQIGGGLSSSRLYCGCSGVPPTPNPSDQSQNIDKKGYIPKCDCDRKSIFGSSTPDGVNSMTGGKSKKNKSVTKENIDDHLYPETGDSPFSEMQSSESEKDKDDEGDNQKGGGRLDDIGNKLVGKTIHELFYMRSKNDYANLKDFE